MVGRGWVGKGGNAVGGHKKECVCVCGGGGGGIGEVFEDSQTALVIERVVVGGGVGWRGGGAVGGHKVCVWGRGGRYGGSF